MNVLILKNIAAEGPGTIADFLRSRGIDHSIIEMHAGERPVDSGRYSHLVVMGGPMAVYEMDRHPFLKDEAKLMEQFIGQERHVLGLCLGAQMLAHVLGARVYPGREKEIGWYYVDITPGGMLDPVMSALSVDGAAKAEVFQWHGDTFDLPAGSLRLASSDLFPNQAFRYADRCYALQFHIEVTPGIVAGWLEHEKAVDLGAVNDRSNRIEAPYLRRAVGAYERFFRED